MSRLLFPDLRDHAVLAAAIGLCIGAPDPLRAGAPIVAELSEACAAEPVTADEIGAVRLPFRLDTGPGRARTEAEARMNFPLFVAACATVAGPVRAQLDRLAALLEQPGGRP